MLRRLFLIIFLLASGYYFFETMVDTVPSIMVNELMQSFHLSAFELGVLDVSYFALAALVQIPGGYLLDKYGAHRVMPMAACCCALGLIIFSGSHSFGLALTGRMLAGLGSAFGILGALFIIASRIPARWLALALGVAMMIGLSGALFDSPMSLVKTIIGWRELTLILAGFALIFALLFYFLLPKDLHSFEHQSYSWHQLKILVQDKSLWLIAFFGGVMYLPAGTLGSLWGANFILMANPALSLAKASSINSLIFLGWIIGSPIAGFCSDFLQKRKAFLVLSSICCLGLLGLLYTSRDFTTFKLCTIFLGLGIFSSFSGLTFAIGAERFSKSRAMVIGWINMWAIIPMLMMNPIFGHVLDHFAPFSLHAYQMALWPLITLVLIACGLGFVLKTR